MFLLLTFITKIKLYFAPRYYIDVQFSSNYTRGIASNHLLIHTALSNTMEPFLFYHRASIFESIFLYPCSCNFKRGEKSSKNAAKICKITESKVSRRGNYASEIIPPRETRAGSKAEGGEDKQLSCLHPSPHRLADIEKAVENDNMEEGRRNSSSGGIFNRS